MSTSFATAESGLAPGAVLHALPSGDDPLGPTAPVGSVMIRLLDRAVATLGRDNAAARDCIARALALLEAERVPVDRSDGLGRGGLAPWQVRRVVMHIDVSLAGTIRIQDCAKIARLSTGHFSRAFKASMGETFSAYVVRRRIERAQEMLILTDEPLSQIALACGFADQQHFTRLFGRQVSSSPAVWRRQRRVPNAADLQKISESDNLPGRGLGILRPSTQPQQHRI